jgi:hypothetical protein
VLAALTSARSKGTDTAVKSNLANTRAQGELWYGAVGSYTGVCGSANSSTATGSVKSIYAMVLAAGGATGLTAVNGTLTTAGSYILATCHENGTAWAAEAPVSGGTSSAAKMWCVDSTGATKAETAALAASAVVCA